MKTKKIDPIVEHFDLEHSETAVEWMDDHGKIRDIEKFRHYLTDTFIDPLGYVLEHYQHFLEICQNEEE